MNPDRLSQIVDAVLYEGHILYPYRPSSRKNRQRFTFGRVYPQAFAEAQSGAETCTMQTQCLLTPVQDGAELEVSVRFLQPLNRDIGVLPWALEAWPPTAEPPIEVVPVLDIDGTLYQSWQEAVERRVSVVVRPGEKPAPLPFSWPSSKTTEPILDRTGAVVGVIVRHQPSIEGEICASTEALGAGTHRATVRVTNRSAVPPEDLEDAEAVLLRTFASTHAVLSARGAHFVSLTDPPRELEGAAAGCRNIGTWPVLVGDAAAGERDTILSSPIILPDYPEIAPESPGSLFDGTEIDEILTLRILTMTEEEKREMRGADDQARRILERTEGLTGESLMRMHGAMRRPTAAEQVFGGNSRLESARVGHATVRAGDRVRLRPRARADIMDIALAGKSAVIEAVEQDAEGRVHLAVTVEDDPGRDLGMLRQPGHRFFYGTDEVEVLEREGKK